MKTPVRIYNGAVNYLVSVDTISWRPAEWYHKKAIDELEKINVGKKYGQNVLKFNEGGYNFTILPVNPIVSSSYGEKTYIYIRENETIGYLKTNEGMSDAFASRVIN